MSDRQYCVGQCQRNHFQFHAGFVHNPVQQYMNITLCFVMVRMSIYFAITQNIYIYIVLLCTGMV